MEKKNFSWQESYSVGCDTIDTQHKHFIELLEQVFDLCRPSSKYNKDKVLFLLRDIMDSTLVHFVSEEEYMRRNKYPALNAHHRHHTEFVIKITEFIQNFYKEEYINMEYLYNFMIEYTLNHMLIEDRAFATYLKNMHLL